MRMLAKFLVVAMTLVTSWSVPEKSSALDSKNFDLAVVTEPIVATAELEKFQTLEGIDRTCQRQCRYWFRHCLENCADPACDQSCRMTYDDCLESCAGSPR